MTQRNTDIPNACYRALAAAILRRACQVAEGRGYHHPIRDAAEAVRTRAAARQEALSWLCGEGMVLAELLDVDQYLRRWLEERCPTGGGQ